jgi:predicted metal-dependent RNase
VNHLKAGIEDPGNDRVFVGYQAYGTPGRSIQDQHGANRKTHQVLSEFVVAAKTSKPFT